MWNCCQIDITGSTWWLINIDSGNGLVPSGNKPLPETILTHNCVTSWHVSVWERPLNFWATLLVASKISLRLLWWPPTEHQCVLIYRCVFTHVCCWLFSVGNKVTTTTTKLNTLRPRQDGRHFADDIFKCIFLNENVWILIKISLKFVPWGPINNIPALVLIMAWCWPGDKPLSRPMMVRLLMHLCVTRPQCISAGLP